METMKKTSSTEPIKRLPLIIMLIMAILSFSNLIGLNLAPAVIPLGVIFFFINKAIEKQSFEGSGLDVKSIGRDLSNKKIWLWIALPLVVNIISFAVTKTLLPEYIEFETARAGSFVAVELSITSALQFFVFALGEEIAWRAFFQKQLSKALPIIPVLLSSSLLFTLGHLSSGKPVLVIYGLIITFINSCLYGVVFHKTNNAWISTISHFAANMFEVMLYVLVA